MQVPPTFTPGAVTTVPPIAQTVLGLMLGGLVIVAARALAHPSVSTARAAGHIAVVTAREAPVPELETIPVERLPRAPEPVDAGAKVAKPRHCP